MESSKKVWGVFNTLNKEELDKLSEYEIWKKIHSLSREIEFTLNYLERPGKKDISIKALIDEQFNLEYLMYYTTKFGVKFDKEPTFGEHIKQSESFNKWYKKCQNHFEIERLKKVKEDIIVNSKENKKATIQLEKAYQ